MATSQPQISLFTEGKSTSSQVDSHVNRTAKPENDLEKKMTATSGRRCLEQYGRFSRVGSWGKTFSALLIGMEGWYSTKCKLTWRMKGTSYNRMYFQLVPSTHRTDATEFGLLPTPCVADTEGSPKRPDQITMKNGRFVRTSDNTGTEFGAKLNDVARLLPTPTASDATMAQVVGENDQYRITATGMPRKTTQHGVDGSVGLARLGVFGMLPTPTLQEYKNSTSPPSQLNRNHVVGFLMRGGISAGSLLNPRFVAEMMGFPPNWTELPFLSGETNP
jgi:hypothetical protein